MGWRARGPELKRGRFIQSQPLSCVMLKSLAHYGYNLPFLVHHKLPPTFSVFTCLTLNCNCIISLMRLRVTHTTEKERILYRPGQFSGLLSEQKSSTKNMFYLIANLVISVGFESFDDWQQKVDRFLHQLKQTNSKPKSQ